MSTAGSLDVAIARAEGAYPEPPWDPSEAYPEYRGRVLASAPNAVYGGVREAFRLLGLDRERFGTPEWSPLRGIVRPGDRVFIKPNLVTHEYRLGCGCPGELFSVITHPSVVRAVADYAALALEGQGEVVVGDNPCIDADFGLLLERTRLDRLAQILPERTGTACRVLDLRPLVTRDLAYYGFRSRATRQGGDPEGETVLDLGERSWFHGLDARRFRGVFTRRLETLRSHHGRTHRYSLSNTILGSDVFISVPKLKAHHKVGATLNVKGLVGINYNKNYLVHWRIGYPQDGGDEFAAPGRRWDRARLALRHLAMDVTPEALYLALRRRLKGGRLDRALQPTYRAPNERYRGAWDGNDTCWRMAADLYEVFVADVTGHRAARARPMRFFSVIDGVVGGEGNGPFCPRARQAGVVLASRDLLAADAAAARLMDYRLSGIRYLDALLSKYVGDIGRIRVVSDHLDTARFFDTDARYLAFAAPSGWPHLALHPDAGGEAVPHGGPP